jgi:hypothetical protein
MANELERCPLCMQPLVPTGDDLGLSPQQRLIYNAIKRFPKTTAELHDLLWPDVGKRRSPGDKAVHVIVNQANERLNKHGLMLRNFEGKYFIVAIELNADSISKPARSPHARSVGSRPKSTRSARVNRGQ